MINGLYSTGYVQAANYGRPNAAQSGPKPSSSFGDNTTGDTAVNSEDKKLSSLTGLFPTAQGDCVTIDDIEQAFMSAKASVEKSLRSLYRQLGIPASTHMEISVNGDGSISVSGESPEAEALAEAINADDELANTIRGMSANASLLQAARDYLEFAAAYERDPIAAVERYGHMLDDNRGYNTTFMFENGNIDTRVEHAGERIPRSLLRG